MSRTSCFFFFNDTATTEIYTLSLHDALPIYALGVVIGGLVTITYTAVGGFRAVAYTDTVQALIMLFALLVVPIRSEEHTSELQSRQYLVCRLLLEKKKTNVRPLY